MKEHASAAARFRNAPSLAIVVPCYNEEEILLDSCAELIRQLQRLIRIGKATADSKIYLVDDGSRDNTWELMREIADREDSIVAVKLSRNRGHQNALHAGLSQTIEEAVVSIDADLQDGAENIETMLDHYLQGSDVVYGVRSERHTDTFFKRFTAEGYYKVMHKLGVDLVFNHADFRLLSRRALNALLQYPEANLFLRGMVRQLGFRSSQVEYRRLSRAAGESKYPLRRMLSLAWSGITAFSSAPLRAITLLGLAASAFSFIVIVWVLATRLFTANAVPGWASILLPLLFIGSVQLLCLGVIGEYIAKLFEEVKQRPRYHIDTVLGVEKSGAIKQKKVAATVD
ncbi:glycosyltransferase family 2 protein [Microbulbifer thermotolerans]|uniref:Glycosyltransferase n=1 Tax=Microbulbifer thermotolerans TaxID=252514 RepID=A0A143HQN1_MICTH|nr:glycosyltransferase family 2 protein [Microbulbifer thermotolerans]AMX03801.1 glycosyltransferase [Microbulbifer thermotolerans]MCX2778707.1 glycosyltransferase family 2 protein [Microbulbifer thermotolerans]MCX2783743.1 glycosyltransferase family 2 protein [Microbulbifer thermotolerans]MCX2794176.1 glycosyltransferase family 2 protein [Microbulbifer thermotolerans]MCX2803105.1 glycosyltransferase family 2 protein [Microbulbifer thermotolerans]